MMADAVTGFPSNEEIKEEARKQAHWDFIHGIDEGDEHYKPSLDDDVKARGFSYAHEEVFGPGGYDHEWALTAEDVADLNNIITSAYIDEYHRLLRGEVQPVDPTEPTD